MAKSNIELKFQQGMLLLDLPQDDDELTAIKSLMKWDPRVEAWTSDAINYREIVLACCKSKRTFVDSAKNYEKYYYNLEIPIVPKEHQRDALSSWINSGLRGVVSLPTGSGKTILAIMAIHKASRPTLVVVPTLDLMYQWVQTLEKYFCIQIGVIGGGKREITEITVSTYDSAAILMETIGNRFGLLICDECHHLPSNFYQRLALSSIAPFRLGLSATLERSDGGERRLCELLGEVVFSGQIEDMVETVLAPYDVVTVEIPLSEIEVDSYNNARNIYLNFVRSNRISLNQPGGWNEFIKKASYLPGGKEAREAHSLQKRIAQGAMGKVAYLWKILLRHKSEHIIVFTDNNELAYRIGRELLLPVVTHKTKKAERKVFLDDFRQGKNLVLVASKVLNEGVDVPEASIAVVVSGSSGVREHVQRLGRILRKTPGKKSILYELVSEQTSEQFVKQRRRQHSAYQKTY